MTRYSLNTSSRWISKMLMLGLVFEHSKNESLIIFDDVPKKRNLTDVFLSFVSL